MHTKQLSYTNSIIRKISTVAQKRNFSFCVLSSEKGLGKRTAVKQFVNDSSYQSIWINSQISTSSFESIRLALKVDDIDAMDLRRSFISFLSSNENVAVIFNNCELYTNDMLDFISDIIPNVLNNSRIKNRLIFVFIYNNTNDVFSGFFTDFITTHGNLVEHVKADRWLPNQLYELFNVIYPQSNCSKEIIYKLISLSFSSPYVFLQILDYLKQKGVFMQTAENWVLKGYNDDILAYNIHNIITKRYDLLDDQLKDTIKKASIIGCEFEVETFENSFSVFNAQILLNQIEEVSRLIHKTLPNELFYSFENTQSNMSIQSLIELDKRVLWNRAIADYFIAKLNDNNTYLTTKEVCEISCKIAFYLTEAKEVKEAIYYNFKLATQYQALGYFCSALKIISQIKTLSNNIHDTNIRLILITFEMECYEALNRPIEALKKYYEYEKICPSSFEYNIWAMHKRALYLYGSGDINTAFSIMQTIEKDKNKKDLTNKRILVRCLDLLSAIKETKRLEYINDYNEAISIADSGKHYEEYYFLLSKANFAHKRDVSIDMMKSAYECMSSS